GRVRHLPDDRRTRERRNPLERSPLHQGRERGLHRTRRALDHHDHVRRRRGAQHGPRGVRRDVRPAPVALATLLGGLWLVPRDRLERGVSRAIDVAGAVSMTAAMLLLVFTLVEAPDAGWTSLRTLGSLATV